MPQHPGHRIKTDKRDAEHIAKSLAYGTYRAVHIPTAEDEQTHDYLRMRNDHQLALKKVKQQINAFCMRLGKHYTSGRTKWTQAHLHWLRTLEVLLARAMLRCERCWWKLPLHGSRSYWTQVQSVAETPRREFPSSHCLRRSGQRTIASQILSHDTARKKHNVAIVAIARELACFICGTMNNRLAVRPTG
jgi:hypothetical protein